MIIKNASYEAIMNLTFAVIGTFIAFFIMARAYFRFTFGICTCETDMTGKTVIVTGANTGIGKCTAMELAKKGARVILACRNKERGESALKDIVDSTGNENVILKDLDLCSFASVRAFADDILKTEDRLHVLINNAGAMVASRQLTEDGCETMMQANHLGHFLLTNLFFDLLKKSAPSRIINVSSLGHKLARLKLDDINGNNMTFNGLVFYSNSKVANILFTRELAKKLKGTGITANSLHPGTVKSDFVRPESGLFVRFIASLMLPVSGKTSLEGAQTSIHLALSPHLEKVTGKYFTDCKEAKESEWSRSDDRAAKLWQVSEELVGLNNKSS